MAIMWLVAKAAQVERFIFFFSGEDETEDPGTRDARQSIGTA